MRKSTLVLLVLALCLASGISMAAGNGKSGGSGKSGAGKVAVVKADKATILAMAAACIRRCEPKLEDKNKKTIDEVKKVLADSKDDPKKLKAVVWDLVNDFTLALASAKSLDALSTAASYIIQAAPGNQRAANLFGSVMCADKRYPESRTSGILAFEYAVSIKPETRLVRLNLANAYLDADKLDKAKPVIDKLVFEDQNDRSAWRAMATYYYKRQDYNHFREALLRAAQYKGLAKKKTDKKNKKIEEQEVQPEDSIPVMESKLAQLQEEVPFTTADIIEDDYPSEAQRIRDKYGKLIEGEKLIMPKLPMVNMNGPREFRTNEPIIQAWAEVQCRKMEKWARRQALEKYGITGNESEAEIKAKGQAGAQKEAAKAMQQAKDMLEYMKNIPGMEKKKAEIEKALRKLQTTGKQVQMGGKSIAPNLKDNPVDMEKIPGFDNGTPWAQMNYTNYFKTARSYELWMFKYFQDYREKEMDIYRVYGKKVQEENENHKERWDELQKEHDKEMEDSEDGPHHDKDIPCRRELLRHRKALNALAVNYYQQWVNLYCPQYAQKMKPTIDAYWSTCALYIKNMNDPEVMKREYDRVRGNYMLYAMQACSLIGGGGAFEYGGETDEEEAQLEADIRAAEQEAEAKKPEFEREFKEPETDWSQWIEDHLVLEISVQALSFKITAKTIEFEASLPGAAAGIKIDVVDEKLETYVASAAKIDVGVNVFGVEAKIEDKAEFLKKTATWDFEKGTYTESYSSKAEAKGTFGILQGTASVELEYDAEIKAKADYNLGLTIEKE